eukprot:810345-Rhodomonas_salina.1
MQEVKRSAAGWKLIAEEEGKGREGKGGKKGALGKGLVGVAPTARATVAARKRGFAMSRDEKVTVQDVNVLLTEQVEPPFGCALFFLFFFGLAVPLEARSLTLSAHSLTLSLTHSVAHSLTHPLTHSLTRSLTHSLTHSLTP